MCVRGLKIFNVVTKRVSSSVLLNTRYNRCQIQLVCLASSKVVEQLHKRKVIKEIFPDECHELAALFDGGKQQCAYAGFDPTADSLHLGNLAIVMGLLHWARTGHKAIALIGGATALIGDPSGRNTERDVTSKEIVEENSLAIQKCLERICNNHTQYFSKNTKYEPLSILNNASWYNDINMVDFLSTAGRWFRMGPMLSRTSVQSRLKSSEGMSFSEFSYQIFQSYDWLHLFDNYRCAFQFGGQDQMGNIHTGRDVIHKIRKASVYGLMLPLLKSQAGGKFGKSSGEALWLEWEKTSPFDLYQFLFRLPDHDIEQYLRIFMFEPESEIISLIEKHIKKPENRLAQRKLAETVTLLVHGEKGLQSALSCTNALFNSTPESLGQLTSQEVTEVFKSATTANINYQPGLSILELAMMVKCFKTINDANRIIEKGGFYLNNFKATNPKQVLVPDDHILPNGITLLRVGKKNYYVVNWK